MGYQLLPTVITRRLPEDSTEDGVYLLVGPTPEEDLPGVFIIIVRSHGRLYSIKIDQEISDDGFTPHSHLLGPLK